MNTAPTAADKTLIVLRSALSYPRFTDIVSSTGLAKSSVHRLLQTLIKHEFLTLGTNGNYYAGPAVLSLAGNAFKQIDISEKAKPFISKLAKDINCQVHIGARNGKEAIYVTIQECDTPYRIPSRIGDKLPLHSTAIGKCFLAQEENTFIAKYVRETGLAEHTPRTITSYGKLLTEIQEVRNLGWAKDDEENVPGIRCIALPIYNHLGTVSHAVSITTLSLEKSMSEVIELVPAVKEVADNISRQLGYRQTEL